MPESPTPSRRLRAALLNLLTAALALGFVLALAELAFGLVESRAARTARPHAEMAVFTRYDAILGWDGVPDVRAPLLQRLVTQNARGERGPERPLPKPRGVRRVVVLGDSQAWGLGVGDDETIAAQLERRLSAEGERWEAVNLGVSGYGTDQAYLKYLLHGARHEPDVVVLVVFKNDLAENAATHVWGVDKPRFGFDGERVCLGNLPPPKAPGWPEDALGVRRSWARWLEWSCTFRFVRGRAFRFRAAPRPEARDLALLRARLPCIAQQAVGAADGARVLRLLLLRFEAHAREAGARLRVLFVPRPIECRQPGRASYYAPAQQEAAGAGLVCIDLRHVAARARVEPEALFLAGDAHLSAAGSALAAEALFESLR